MKEMRAYKVWFINKQGIVITEAMYNSERVAEMKKKELEGDKERFNVKGRVFVSEVEIKIS